MRGSLFLVSLLIPLVTLAAAPASVQQGGKTYYVVNGNDPAMDTGKEACAAVGRLCTGYTALGSNAICKKLHPKAKTITSINGSKAGFYCDGAPQKGLACEKAKNTCQVCPKCNVNADCNTQIGQQFREMYVECGAKLPPPPPRPPGTRRTPSTGKSKTYGPLPMPKSNDPRIGTQRGKMACEFYQATKPGDLVRSNKKLVNCKAVKAADAFCVTAMQSRFAKAAKCEDSGIIVCTISCNEGKGKLTRCAADADRPRGINAPPLEFCTK